MYTCTGEMFVTVVKLHRWQ